jgi:NodT family efflux transporter outer membrane factor (OMF) lipoprotein
MRQPDCRRPLVMTGTLSLLGMVLVLTGCAVGPKFQRPDVTLNQGWSQKADAHLTQAPADSAWWRAFNDTTLDRLVETAYHQNLSLQVAGLRVMEARAQLKSTAGRQYPQVQTVVGNATAVGLSDNAATSVGFDKDFVDYQVGFDAAWEADFWGKFSQDVKAQSMNYFATEADYDNALVVLTAEVARTYAMIRTYGVLLAQARQNVTLQEEGLRIARARFESGATSELDVTQATTLLESTRASIPLFELELSRFQNALSTLLGQPAGSVQALTSGTQVIPVAPAAVAVDVPAQLLRRRPDIRSVEYSAAAQCSRIGVAQAELYPRFALFGTIGTQASGGTANSGNLFDPGSLFYAFGPRLVWPIFNYGRISNNVRVQDARLQQLLVDYQNTVLKAAQEVEDGMTGYLKSREASVFAENAAKSAQRSADLALVQYKEGAVDFQRVLDAQRSLLQEQNSMARTQSAIATHLISLYKALGGGWEVRKGQPFVPDSTRIEMQHRTNWGNLFDKPPAPPASSTSNTSTPNR